MEREDMKNVTVSPKYQVVIPKEIREAMGLKPGQKLAMFYLDGMIKMVRVMSMEEAYGSLPGLDSTVERDEEDRV
jgi:AbrB family looped-hinge helix DNA binding protein